MANNRPSEVDKHSNKMEIEACLARKVPLRRLEKRYGISTSALSRHRQRMKERSPAAYAAMEARNWAVTPEELQRVRTETHEGWIVALRGQVDRLQGAQDCAFEDQRWGSGAQIAGQVLTAMRMLGEATSNLGDGSTQISVQNNVVYTTEFAELRTTILTALRPYPTALKAVLAALRGDQPPQPPVAALEAPVEACAA